MHRAHLALIAALAALPCAVLTERVDGVRAFQGVAEASPSTQNPAGAPAATSDPDPEPTLSPQERRALEVLSPPTLPPPPKDITNRYADDPRAAALGRKFFFDTRFSGRLLDGDNDGSPSALGRKGQSGRVACAGCHVPSAGFLDNRSLGQQISLGAGWARRRAPSLLDVAQGRLFMWDGRRDTLYNQPFGPLESPVEMNTSRLFVAEAVWATYRPEYEAVFGRMPSLGDPRRFPVLPSELTGCQPRAVDPEPDCHGTMHGLPGDRAEFDGMAPADQALVTRVVVNVGKALEAFERKLTCGPGRFDRWIHGAGPELSRAEQRGAALFVGRGECNKCHAGPYLSDQAFHNTGLKPTPVAVVFLDADDHGAASGLALASADPLNSRGPFSDGDDGRLSKFWPAIPGRNLLSAALQGDPLAPTPVTPNSGPALSGTRAGQAGLDGAFRTPALRCVGRRPSFMHTGQFKTLDETVEFFDRGGDPFGYPGASELHALGLGPRDRADLVAFLRALEGSGPAVELTRSPQ